MHACIWAVQTAFDPFSMEEVIALHACMHLGRADRIRPLLDGGGARAAPPNAGVRCMLRRTDRRVWGSGKRADHAAAPPKYGRSASSTRGLARRATA